MSTRATAVLLVILLGCVAVALFVQGPGSTDRQGARAALLPGLKPADVAMVRISRARAGAGSELLLTRVGGAWKVGAAMAPADGVAVDALLAKLAGVREGVIVSANPAKQSVYEADTDQGIAVRLEDAGGRKLGAFVVGGRGPDFASCYLRRDGATEVRLVTPDLRTDFSRTADSWREPPKTAGTPAPAAEKPIK